MSAPHHTSTESQPELARSQTLAVAARSVLSDSALFDNPQDRDLPPHAAFYPLLDKMRAMSASATQDSYAPPLSQPFGRDRSRSSPGAGPAPPAAPAPAPAPPAVIPVSLPPKLPVQPKEQPHSEPAFAAESDVEETEEGIPLRPLHTQPPPFDTTEP